MNNRFDRHTLIPGWSQDRLSSSSVIITGMGALGNEVSRLLAMSGVGDLIICDYDWVEESNLSRMILFRQTDIGRLKVEAAAEKLQELWPGIRVQTRPFPLVHGIGMAELRDADLVLGCLDSRAARLQLAGRCQLVKAKYIDGGTHPWGGEVRLYLDPEGPCYGCSLAEKDRAVSDIPWSCLQAAEETKIGAAVPSSALVGTWMGIMAVRFLMGLACPAGILRVDATRGTTVNVEQKKDPGCMMHSPLEKVKGIPISNANSVEDLKKCLPAVSTPLVWSPIQERLECPGCDYREVSWGLPSKAKELCPRCSRVLRPRTTLELVSVPGDMELAALGIPPREILAVRVQQGIEWYELQNE